MQPLQVGFAKADITPQVGARLVGYASRKSGSTGVHDTLAARAMVVERGGQAWAVVSLDLCYFVESFVEAVREIVSSRTTIPGDHVFLCATHTHSGPWVGEADRWSPPLPDIAAGAVAEAAERLQPARLAAGYGFLYGHSINRRWLHRPVDPAVTVVRFDDASGAPLGLVTNFGLHGVVLGADNLLISADWPGYAMSALENELDGDVVCLFTQGGGANVNPLTDAIREAVRSGRTVCSIGKISTYYGQADDAEVYDIGSRAGGTFEEVAVIGQAFAEEVLRVARGLRPVEAEGEIWVERVPVETSLLGDDSGCREDVPDEEHSDVPGPEAAQPFELMMVGVQGRPGMVMMGQPGEVFAETAVQLRRAAEKMGYICPLVISYANGWKAYLPPEDAFPEGGYEVNWARKSRFSPQLQDRIWNILEPRLAAHSPAKSVPSDKETPKK